MSSPTVIYWPPSEGSFIATVQSVAENGTLALFRNVPAGNGAFQYNNIIRSISIGSSLDIPGVTFRISGIGAAVDGSGNPTSVLRPITEDVFGVTAAEAVETVHIFTQINSITVLDEVAPSVYVKYGTFGITNYVFTDYNRRMAQISVSGQVVGLIAADAGLRYSVHKSLNKPESSTVRGYREVKLGIGGPMVPFPSSLDPYGVQIVDGIPTQITFIPAGDLIGDGTTTRTAVNDGPEAVIWAKITNTTTDSLYFTVLQQGIN